MAITIYGIKNCDTMKKARAWLDKQGVGYVFHDYKASGIDKKKLEGWAAKTGEGVAIEHVLRSYEQALNSSDTEQVMTLYADDGVFMQQHSPSAVGSAAVRMAYDAVFHAIRLTVKFDIVEIRQIAPDWAFARTNSAGSVRVNATGACGPEANQELFLFQKIGGEWKIARYSFSTTNPPRG